MTFTHVYHWSKGPLGAGGPDGAMDNPVRAALRGQRCCIVAGGSLGTVCIETERGWVGTTSRRALRRLA